MKRKNEVILQNTMLENVLQYLYDKLKEIHNANFDKTLKDGTIYYYSLYVNPVQSSEIEVAYSTSITPKGDIEKSYAMGDMYPAMSFEGLQLQTNTVKIKAKCHRSFIVSTFDNIWDDMLKAFGAAKKFEEEAANTMSVPETTIQAPPPRQDELEKVRAYSLDGKHTIVQIARKTGLGVSTVNRYRKELGIRRKQ